MSSPKKSSKQSPLIYCGPNLPNTSLATYTTYVNGFPANLEPHFDACPALRRLFVSPSKVAEMIDAMNKAGTAENLWLNEVTAYGGANR